MDDWGGLIGALLVIAAIIFVVYVIVMIASVLAAVAGGAGVLFGYGGRAKNLPGRGRDHARRHHRR